MLHNGEQAACRSRRRDAPDSAQKGADRDSSLLHVARAKRFRRRDVTAIHTDAGALPKTRIGSLGEPSSTMTHRVTPPSSQGVSRAESSMAATRLRTVRSGGAT